MTLYNPYDKDTIVYASRSWYLEADGKQYHIQSADDIPLYPTYQVLAAHQSIEYSLDFDRILEMPQYMDLIMDHGIRIYGIKCQEQ